MNSVKKMRPAIIFFVSLFFSAVVSSAVEKDENEKLPLGCYNTGYTANLKILTLFPGDESDNQSMYFIYNGLNENIILHQMRGEESSRSLYLNHAINPHQWAVLSTSEKKVKFICTTPSVNSRYGNIVDCGSSLKTCEYTNVRYGLNNRGNYWLVDSNVRNAAVSAVVHYGIIPGQ